MTNALDLLPPGTTVYGCRQGHDAADLHREDGWLILRCGECPQQVRIPWTPSPNCRSLRMLKRELRKVLPDLVLRWNALAWQPAGYWRSTTGRPLVEGLPALRGPVALRPEVRGLRVSVQIAAARPDPPRDGWPGI